MFAVVELNMPSFFALMIVLDVDWPCADVDAASSTAFPPPIVALRYAAASPSFTNDLGKIAANPPQNAATTSHVSTTKLHASTPIR